jgi:hypothetical protein
LLLTLVSTLAAWRALQATRRELLPLVATWTGAFSCGVILLQWIALFIELPCMHSP